MELGLGILDPAVAPRWMKADSQPPMPAAADTTVVNCRSSRSSASACVTPRWWRCGCHRRRMPARSAVDRAVVAAIGFADRARQRMDML
jgi:hypothetical protein